MDTVGTDIFFIVERGYAIKSVTSIYSQPYESQTYYIVHVLRCNEAAMSTVKTVFDTYFVWQCSKTVRLWILFHAVQLHCFLVSSSERYHEAFAEVTEEMVSREAGYGLEVPWVVRLNGVHSQDEGASRNPYC